MVPELSVRSSSGSASASASVRSSSGSASASASVLELLLAVQMVLIVSWVDYPDNNVG
jgi:hypothetical protein